MAKRKRRTNLQFFLDKLTALSNDEQRSIGNVTLRQVLGWKEHKYEGVKRSALAADKITVGKGKGGSVRLTKMPGADAHRVFVSYSHNDETLKNQLIAHLRPLERAGLIKVWHDVDLDAGDELDKEIFDELSQADIILLLVSVDFINSKYCYEKELVQAIARHDAGKAHVVPVILRKCLWDNTPFSKLKALPKDGKAVTSWINVDEAFFDVALNLRRLIEGTQE